MNAILDPILIFGLDLELTGAALASVAARVVIGVTAVISIIRYYNGFIRSAPVPLLRDLRPIAAIAVPAILTQFATPIGQAYVTRSMAEFGEAAVAGMAIVALITRLHVALETVLPTTGGSQTRARRAVTRSRHPR